MEKTSKEGLPLFLPVQGYGSDFAPQANFYELHAVLKDGRKFRLVYGSDEYTIRYLEAAITQHLRLQDSSSTIIAEVIPAGLEVQREFDSFKVTYRSFSWMIMLGCLLIAIFGLGLGTMLLISTGRSASEGQIALFVALLMRLSGVYMSLVTALNRTVIDISSEQIRVHTVRCPPIRVIVRLPVLTFNNSPWKSASMNPAGRRRTNWLPRSRQVKT